MSGPKPLQMLVINDRERDLFDAVEQVRNNIKPPKRGSECQGRPVSVTETRYVCTLHLHQTAHTLQSLVVLDGYAQILLCRVGCDWLTLWAMACVHHHCFHVMCLQKDSLCTDQIYLQLSQTDAQKGKRNKQTKIVKRNNCTLLCHAYNLCVSNINNWNLNILSTPQNHFKINGSNEKCPV